LVSNKLKFIKEEEEEGARKGQVMQNKRRRERKKGAAITTMAPAGHLSAWFCFSPTPPQPSCLGGRKWKKEHVIVLMGRTKMPVWVGGIITST
jgi:hypothetical protein